MNRIGTERESSLHRELKYRYAGPGGRIEAETAGFVADGIREDGEIIEVQIGSFGPLRRKAKELAGQGRLRIIHPVIINKYLEVFDNEGKWLYRRKSPCRGKPWDLFKALIHAPELPLIAGVSIELAVVDVTENRIQDGKGSWRRKGASIANRTLAAWHEHILLESPKDYRRFIPYQKGEEFTAPLLAQKAGISANLAGKTLYVLNKLKVVKRIGKRRNAFVYCLWKH